VWFCGAYHGWWGDVQPGVRNPLPAHETYTLAEMSEATLHVLRSRRDVACVQLPWRARRLCWQHRTSYLSTRVSFVSFATVLQIAKFVPYFPQT
jgi:hypothetical protein